MKAIAGLCALLGLVPASPSIAQQTEIHSCLEEGTYCSESPPDTLDPVGLACGKIFYQFTGRVSWPPLTNLGPITISVQTLDGGVFTPFPLYIELRNAPSGLEGCTTLTAGKVVIVANSVRQCGGVWETIGPIDLTQFTGVPIGGKYLVQAVFLRDRFSGDGSVGLACIHVRPATTTLARQTWSLVKALYR